MQKQMDLYTLSKQKVAPVLYGYVCWALKEAEKRGICTLYFLSRDGYILLKIAQQICEKKKIRIECRYLYCSRASLRMPAYHLIGEEAYRLLFQGGYHVTLKSLLERTQIPRQRWKEILKDAGINSHALCEENFSKHKTDLYKKRLMKSTLLQNMLNEWSNSAYKNAIAYFKQEKVLENQIFAIVDSGWVGSMQRSFRQLLEAAGWRGSIVGFYFGMFANPAQDIDGTYKTWYFSKTSGRKNKILFCNNLFECFLSAPHGMTMAYQADNEKMVPVLKENLSAEQKTMIECQICGILDGTKKLAECGRHISKKTCSQILYRLMSRPVMDEVRIYRRFLFCDDMTDGYLCSLADETKIGKLKNTLLWVRLFHRLFQIPENEDKPFWSFGMIACVKNPVVRQIYWMNEYLCQWLRYSLR